MGLLDRLRGSRETETDAPANPAAGRFAALYDEHVDHIYRYCRLRIDDPADAEDTAALIFAQAFAAYPPADSASFRSWLFAIAHNVVANHHRARHTRRCHRPLDEAGDLPDPGASPEESAYLAEERRALRAALARLPHDQRRVVELRLAGLSGQEIAASLGRSHAAVKMLQLRAVERLRDLLIPASERTRIQIRHEEADHAARTR